MFQNIEAEDRIQAGRIDIESESLNVALPELVQVSRCNLCRFTGQFDASGPITAPLTLQFGECRACPATNLHHAIKMIREQGNSIQPSAVVITGW